MPHVARMLTYTLWYQGELKRMAATEREALSIGVKSHIASYLGCSRYQISCRRKKDDYKAIPRSFDRDAQCPGPDGHQVRAVRDSLTNDYPTNGNHESSRGRPGHAWSARETKVLQQAPPDALDAELAPLLPGRTIIAIRSKWRRQVAPKFRHTEPVTQVPMDE